MDALTDLAPAALRPARPHAVVIGAGLGGLAAAIRLGARGYRVTVLDRLEAPGGRAFTHRQDGFTFDAGPTIVTAPFLLEELWALCGKRMADSIDLRPVAPFYRIRFDDGETFDYSGDRDAMRAEVARLSPEDVPGFERFMAHSLEACRIGFEQLGHLPFGRVSDMLRVAPALLRLGGFGSVYRLASRFFRDERLRTVFSFHPLLIGGNPFTASGLYALIPALEQRWGVHWPMGGMGRIVEGLASLIEGQGGSLRCGAEVARITLEGGRATGVLLKGGEHVPAAVVVSNADAAFTYRHLLPEGTEPRWSHRRADRARQSMGLFVWYFGTRRKYEDVGHHTILLGPRYRGLLRDIFARKVLSEDFSLYLHRPSASDPAMAPPGHDSFYVLSPVPNLAGGTDWAREAEPYRQAVARRLAETVMPGFESEIVTSRVATPLDFQSRLLATQGSGFGLEPVLWQSAWFRPHNRSSGVPNLFLVGAGTHPGAGVPGVLSSARVLDTVVPHANALV